MVTFGDYDDSASTSSGTSLKTNFTDPIFYRYDVFLSFRGPDTRNTFTDHLYHRLIGAGIQTFRDDAELRKGEPLEEQLEKAIKDSAVSIIVFSENYPSSRWCLDEVVRILEQKKEKRNHKVLCIFYHVDVSVVKYQTGSYEKAFDRHMEKGYVSPEKIKAWKAALTEAADSIGFPLDKDKGGPETEFIGEIVKEVEYSLPNRKVLDVPIRLLGMNYRGLGVDSWLKDRSGHNNVLVLYGIGGIGKTTIAKHLFNKYYQYFEGSCFLAGITALWKEIGVCSLQSRLLTTVLNKREEIRIYNCDEGTEYIKRALCTRKVLVVLDDVSETEQLEALLGQEQRFYPGSKILLTTRNMSLVKDFIVDTKFNKVEGLGEHDSLELFSWHAFRQDHPKEEYEQLSKEILLRCEGHPLTLKVLGSSLRKNLRIDFWEKQLKKWNDVVSSSIQKVMQISYDSLEDDKVQNLFLHVACFFVGEEEDYVVKILDHCGLHAAVGIQNLIDRCLIEITEDKKLMMHQVIQDMGREIVKQESPAEPGERSRLWYYVDSFLVLKYDKGTDKVQGLILDGQKINKVEPDKSSFADADENSYLITRLLGHAKKIKEEVYERYLSSKEGELRIDSFAKMVNLKLLKLNYVHLTGLSNKFSKELRWISWHGFPLDYVPSEFPLENLVALDLQHSVLKKVWKRYMEVKSLKFLNLSYSLELHQTPDFRGLLQLERLILRGCSNLIKVCETIKVLTRLVLLDLRECKSLRDLPVLPEFLSALYLSGCPHVGEFPRDQQNVEASDVYRIVKYASPNISRGPVKWLSSLPHMLVVLKLQGCNLSDECFPREFSGLSSLETLDLRGNLITRLPDCVTNLSSSTLHHLDIRSCPNLLSVIHTPKLVEHLYPRNSMRRLRPHFYLEYDEMTPHFENKGCFKWVKAGNVERKVLKKLGLELVPIGYVNKVLYEFGIFSTFIASIPGLPPCFNSYHVLFTDYTDKECYLGAPYLNNVSDRSTDTVKLRYTIPCSIDRKIQGLNICFIKEIDPEDPQQRYYMMISVTVCNKTKDLAWTYCYDERFEELGRACQDYMWVSMWKCGDLLEAGDEIEVTFKAHYLADKLNVKECGVRIVYDDDDDEGEDKEDLRNISLLWSEEMDISFSSYHTPGINYYLLGLLPGNPWGVYIFRQGHTEGRLAQFVSWWGANLNPRSPHEVMYVFGCPPRNLREW